MMHAFALVAAVVVAQSGPGGPPSSQYDAFSRVLSDQQRSQIGRDSRCADAKASTDQFTSTKDVKVGVKAMVALEQCAVMTRVGDWSDYHDYLLTAAGAVAYEIGVLANEPKAFSRALKDVASVQGFQAPASVTVVTLGNRTAGEVVTEGQHTAGGQAEMEAGLPMQNSATKQHNTTHTTGYSGPYGVLATEVGEASQAALERRSPPASAGR